MAKMMDIIVGNTCVLIDRHPGNRERRKLYGLAGEYRLPKHGFEYRTPSNFWMQGYPLMSFVLGMARIVCAIVSDTKNGPMMVKAFMDAVPEDDIRRAINTNNFHLAYKNFKAIEPLLMEVTQTGDVYPLHIGTIKQFHYFVQTVREHGLEYWFKEDSLNHWCNLGEGHGFGAYDFLTKNVVAEMMKNPEVIKKPKETKVKKASPVKKTSPIKKDTPVKKKATKATKVAKPVREGLIKRMTKTKTAKRATSRPVAVLLLLGALVSLSGCNDPTKEPLNVPTFQAERK